MNSNPVLRNEERVYALWAVEDSIGDVLAAATSLYQARENGDLQQMLPAGGERLQRIESQTSALLEDLIGLKRDYEAQFQGADAPR
jgi:hypothetical protein